MLDTTGNQPQQLSDSCPTLDSLQTPSASQQQSSSQEMNMPSNRTSPSRSAVEEVVQEDSKEIEEEDQNRNALLPPAVKHQSVTAKEIRFSKVLDIEELEAGRAASNSSGSSVGGSIQMDGGWGWVIVFASFMCNVIVDGIIFSFGIILFEISRSFPDGSKGGIAWIGSLQAGFYLTEGPIVSAFANKYGCRTATMLGSVIAATGFILGFGATTMAELYLTLGVLAGIGFGFVYLPAVVTVGYYFEKRRAFATGIAVCGSGIGGFVMAPVTQALIDAYGWRGALLVLAGVILNCCVFGSLFRPVYRVKTLDDKPFLSRVRSYLMKRWRKKETDRSAKDVERYQARLSATGSSSRMSQPPPYDEVCTQEQQQAMLPPVHRKSEPNLSTPSPAGRPHKGSVSHADRFRRRSRRHHSFHSLGRSGPGCGLNPVELKAEMRRSIGISFFSLANIEMQIFQKSRLGIQDKTEQEEDLDEDQGSSSSIGLDGCLEQLRDMFQLRLLASPSFLLFSIAGFLTLLGFFIPFLFIVEVAVREGRTQDEAAILLSVIGITNTLGRVCCGWISDKPQISALFINNIALLVAGAATAVAPLISYSYTLLVIYCAIFGFGIACFAALRSVITVELLGLNQLTNAFGLLLLFQGVATFIGGPMAGLFFDWTGNFNASFYLGGAVIALSGLCGFPLTALSRREKNQDSSITQ